MAIEFEEDVCECEFKSSKEKKRFLAQLAGVRYTSIIGDDEKLLNEIKIWMNL